MDFDQNDAAVLAAMVPETRLAQSGTKMADISKKTRQVFGRSNVTDRHGEEFLTAVTVVGYGSVIDREKCQRFEVVHPHRLRIALEHLTVTGFALLQCFFPLRQDFQ